MRLFEFEAKNILNKYGISIPQGNVAQTAAEAQTIARKIGKAVALKSQILVAGRGKAGGILFADNAAEARKMANNLLGQSIKGNIVKSLLVEEKLDIAAQYYASVTIDRQAKTFVILASIDGGVDIEETAKTSPEKIARQPVKPGTFLSQSQALDLLGGFKMRTKDAERFAASLVTLYRAAMESDAELAEINPLVKTTSDTFMAADARIIIDDNALFRHPEFANKSLSRVDDTPLEAEARKQNLAYVDLDGDVGIVGNGAGLVMATLDLVSYFGGKPANFLDAGGGGNVEVTKKGIMLVMSKPEVKAVLVNILGGITRCDIVAQAVVESVRESKVKKPVVVRMMGTNEELGNKMLNDAGIHTFPTMEKAVEEVVKFTK